MTPKCRSFYQTPLSGHEAKERQPVASAIFARATPLRDEFPKLRTLVGDFSGLIDLWERDRCPKTLSQQW